MAARSWIKPPQVDRMNLRYRIVIFDIDGTLADSYHRIGHIVNLENVPDFKKDWEEFDKHAHADTPIPGMVELCTYMQAREDLDVLFLTGRSDRTRTDTWQWLRRHGLKPRHPDLLQMRIEGDHRHADIIKLQRLQELQLHPGRVMTLFDDDTRVVKLLREHGYHACHVAEDRYGLAQEGGRDEESLAAIK
jgi:predicted secreted acid phosphatase